MSYEQLSTHPNNTSHDRTRNSNPVNDDEAELELLEETEGIAGAREYHDAGSHAYRDPERIGNGRASSKYDVPLSKEARKRIWWRHALINLFFIGCWFIFATLLSVYNKWMFSETRYGFTWPFFVTALHMVVQFALSGAARYFFPRRFKPEFNPSREDYVKKVVPTALTTGLDIGLSNQSLKLITLSFYTMCKSSSLIFVLIFAFLFHLERFSLRLISVILLIFFGVLMMVATETQFSLPGFLLVISGSALGGLRWSLTQLLLKDRKVGMSNPIATIFWLSPIQAAALLVLSALTDDWREMFGSRFFDGLGATLHTSFFLVFPGVLAFCMILSEVSIIQHAGVVPMSIAGIAKEVTTISISAWLFDDRLTPLNVVGVGITVSGIALFTYHKYQKSVLESRDGSPRLEEREELERMGLSEGMMRGVDGLPYRERGDDMDESVDDEDTGDDVELIRQNRYTPTRQDLNKPLPPLLVNGHDHDREPGGGSSSTNVLFSIADEDEDGNENPSGGINSLISAPKVHSGPAATPNTRKVTFAEQPLDEDGRVWSRQT